MHLCVFYFPTPDEPCAEDNDKGCQRVLQQFSTTGNEHVGSDVMHHFRAFAEGHVTLSEVSSWTLEDQMGFIFNAEILPFIPCVKHNRMCMLEPANDLGIAGWPCVDYSPAGSQRGVFGPTFPILLAILAWHRYRRTKIIALENVPEFPVCVIFQLMEDMYEIHYYYMHPADAGCPFLARMRVFFLLTLKG